MAVETRNFSSHRPKPAWRANMLKLMPMPPCDPPLSVKEAAKALGRSETWVRDHVATGLLERDASATGLILVSAASVERAKLLERPRRKTLLRLVVNNSWSR